MRRALPLEENQLVNAEKVRPVLRGLMLELLRGL
jgi:hypothetical protein